MKWQDPQTMGHKPVADLAIHLTSEGRQRWRRQQQQQQQQWAALRS